MRVAVENRSSSLRAYHANRDQKLEAQMRRHAIKQGHDVEAFILRWQEKKNRKSQLSADQIICPDCDQIVLRKDAAKNYICRPCKRERDRNYQHPDPDQRRAQALACYYRHHEKYRARHARNLKKYRAKYPERHRHLNNQRRVRKLNNGGSFTLQEWLDLCVRYQHKCLCCKQEKVLSIDHVLPLSKGGRNDIANIQPLCIRCNSSKGAKTIDYREVLEI
jgi:hypothetical protein